tara:strand:- start:864 stop:1055 length:192 start_codon:yes stop_codon:yes gene_type:complete
MNAWARSWWADRPIPEVVEDVEIHTDYTPDPEVARRHRNRAFSKRNLYGDSSINPDGTYRSPE